MGYLDNCIQFMNILKELFPYKQYKETKCRYYICFVEECILNEKFIGYTGGRCEIRVDEEQYAIREYRFLTNKKSFYKFANFIECKHYNIIGLHLIRLILKYCYSSFKKGGN